ncbi:MAG: hypothetical protein K6C14_01605 [Eubacterium sp.]|nr:hypothetical protein [Eubacterium sp.]
MIALGSVQLSAYAAVKAPAAPKVTASSTVNTVKLKWKKVSGASGYEVYSYKNKKYKKLKTLTAAKLTVKKLTAGTSYVYAVRAYKKSGSRKRFSKYSRLVKVSTLPKAPTGLYMESSSYASVTLSWKKVSGATGYTVYYSPDSNLSKDVRTFDTKTNTACIKLLKDNSYYYYNVQAYRVYNKKTYYSAKSSKAISFTKEIPGELKTTVNLSKRYQTVNGFGTSSAWNFQRFGSWENAEDILRYLYDPNKGIGLNIYRYNVGAGSKNDETMGNYWNRTEGFVKSVDFDNQKITYDFTADAAAQNCLKIAKKLAGNNLRVTLFHNSPPVELTVNGKAYGTGNGEEKPENMASNLDSANYNLYSQFCVDVADYFVKSGYRVTDVSPMNEPVYSWDGSGQEGCHFTPAQASQLYAVMINKAKNKSYKISMFEAGAAEDGYENGDMSPNNKYLYAIMSNKTNSAYFDTFTTHSYWSDKARKALCRSYIDNTYPGMKIACTEYCQMFNDWSTGVHDLSEQASGKELNGYGITYGVQMARTIYEDLTVLNAVEWNWWLGVSCGYYPDGLVYIDNQGTDHSVIEPTKRLWCLGNFSKFIKEGAVRVDASSAQDKLLSASFLNKDGSLVVVYINTTKDYNLKANICVNGYTKYKAYETSENRDLALVSSGEFENGKQISVPAESVVSVIITK